MFKPSTVASAGGIALLLALSFVVGWEAYLRSQGFELSYNDDESLWAHHQRIYQSSPAAPVLIGSSRIKFGNDLATWEAITGDASIQLTHSGTSPRPVLKDLAEDENFTGTVIVDVTEAVFFTPTAYDKFANSSVKFYPNWSLAQQASFHVNQALESQLLFLDEERFALRFLLERLRIPVLFISAKQQASFASSLNTLNPVKTLNKDYSLLTKLSNPLKKSNC